MYRGPRAGVPADPPADGRSLQRHGAAPEAVQRGAGPPCDSRDGSSPDWPLWGGSGGRHRSSGQQPDAGQRGEAVCDPPRKVGPSSRVAAASHAQSVRRGTVSAKCRPSAASCARGLVIDPLRPTGLGRRMPAAGRPAGIYMRFDLPHGQKERPGPAVREWDSVRAGAAPVFTRRLGRRRALLCWLRNNPCGAPCPSPGHCVKPSDSVFMKATMASSWALVRWRLPSSLGVDVNGHLRLRPAALGERVLHTGEVVHARGLRVPGVIEVHNLPQVLEVAVVRYARIWCISRG
jgi:hypothetical protein